MTDYRSPLLDWPGAVAAGGPDAGTAWHYGDPLGEQRRAVAGAGLVDRSHRDVLVVPGPDRLDWLHAICSQHLSALADGDSTEALVLSPNGHVEQHWQLTELGDQVWIDTEPHAGDEVLGYLLKMRFLKRVEPAVVTAEYAVLSLVGPDAAEVLDRAGLPVPDGRADCPARRGFRASGAVARRPGGPDRRPGRAARRRRPAARRRGRNRSAAGPPRRCGSNGAGPGWAWTPTTGRWPTRRAGSARRCTWTRAATAARRRWPGCRTSASRRAGWCCCTCPGTPSSCRRRAARSSATAGRWASSAPPCSTTSSGPIALAIVKRGLTGDDVLSVPGHSAVLDPADAVAELPTGFAGRAGSTVHHRLRAVAPTSLPAELLGMPGATERFGRP